jgi:hypothetical protein
MALLIQTSPDPYYSERVRLDGRDYILRFAWNQREERWRLSILADNEEPIIHGLKLLTGWPLLRYYRFDRRLPPGELYVVDSTGNRAPPGLEDLGEGRRCQLVYLTQEELTELAEEQ